MFRLTKITIHLIKSNTMAALIYPANFYAGTVSSFLWIGLAMVSISVLTYQSPEIGGWNRYQLFAVQGIYSIIMGLMYFTFGENFKKLVRLINRGDLDLQLIKPIDSQFIASVGENKLYNLSRSMGGIILLVYSLIILQISPSFIDILLFCLFIGLSCTVIYSIWFMLVTLTIWLTNLFNIDELFIHITGLSRYPLEIFRYLSKYIFYVTLPLVVITSVPAQIILQKVDFHLVVSSIVIAFLFFSVSRRFWFFALKYYSSASS